ncbi:MAG: serine hydrolase [Bacteroidia bacterium]
MKKLISIIISLLLSHLSMAQAGKIQLFNGEFTNEEKLDAMVKDKMSELHIAGLSLALINDGEITYSRNYGYTNYHTQNAIASQTLFEAASMTKPVFAWLVMKLVEQGIVDLDRPMYQYLPYKDIENDERYKKITARMVLTHSTGFPNWRYGRPLSISFEPGTDFSYSGEGFVYLGKVLEHLTKRNLEQLFQDEVFKPLGMTHSTAIWSPYYDAKKAMGHYNGNVPSKDFYQSLEANPAASLLTNTIDFTKFMLAVINLQGLQKQSYDEIFKLQVKPSKDNSVQNKDESIAWGLGWVREETPFGIKYQHGGNNGDFESYFELSTDKKFGYVYFTNSDKGDELNQILKPFLTSGEVKDLPSKHLSENEKKAFIEEHWNFTGYFERGKFKEKQGLFLYSDSEAWLKNKKYKNFIAEFDIAIDGYCFAGIKFRQKDNDNFETYFLRANETGTPHASQYTPVFNGNSGWQLYTGFNYARTVQIREGEWMHIKIAVFDDWMEVYVDDMDNLALHVFDLKHSPDFGAIGLWTDSPAYFANFKVKEVDTYTFFYDRQPKPIPETGTITHWEISSPFSYGSEITNEFADKLNWSKTVCEYNGLVNISREATLSYNENTVLAKFEVYSDEDQRKELQFGYSDIATIYLNGINLYQGDRTFRSRDASYYGTIGYYETITLNLKKGQNTIWFEVTENYGGWGVMAKFKNLHGITLK